MRKRKRKPADKSVRCTVRVIVDGKCVKTVKRRLTMNQAVREVGGDPLGTEGRLVTGLPLNKKRSIVRGVSVVLMYVADHRPRPQLMCVDMNIGDAVGVIRAGLAM